MRIGFDFDNTIVSYDALFHKVALEQGVVDQQVPVSKLAVRDHLRATNQEDIWTEMQGYVYGARMTEAEAYPSVFKVMRNLKNAGHTLAIVSHKTKHPYLGRKYDLHASARQWIDRYLCVDGVPLIANENIFFEVTKEDKISKISEYGCDVFIDDLPEILLATNFPVQTQRFLFDPEQHHSENELPNIRIVSSWKTFESCVL
jgi:FMN phosphatase YigB (HAD superfamily)